MKPLVVTAHLATAYSAADPWSPSLDGILAYWWLREHLGEEEFALGMSGHREQVDPVLPLGREEYDGLWWWQCSSPITEPRQRFQRYFHKRFDNQYAVDMLPEKTGKVLTAGGPFKEFRNPRYMTVAPEVHWHCIGDADEIRRLLRLCYNIGFGYTKGYGQVMHWTVEESGDAHIARFHRPLPVEFAAEHRDDVGTGSTVMTWGYRSPGRDPANQTLCVMP